MGDVMKVYVVLCYYFDDTSIEHICLTEEKANEEKQKLVNKNLMYHYYDVEDHEVTL